MRGLKDKVAIVAGGAGGIGTATSVRLAEEGAAVVVGDLDGSAAEAVAKEITGRGGTALSMALDISDEDSVRALVARATDDLGGLDILHANAADLSAGTIGQDSDVVGIDMPVFDRTMQVNMRGHFLCARHAIPALLDRGGGALIFTSSAAAYAGEPERPSYAMAKSAVNALVRHIASKWGKQGIRANGIMPGLVLTDALWNSIDENFKARVLKGTRSSRLGTPEDIAAMVAFLASDDAQWVNGQVVSVDGGTLLR